MADFTTVANVRAVPLLCNVLTTDDWLQSLVTAATQAIKRWTKQTIEATQWTEYHDGNEQTQLVLQQFPVLAGSTQLAAASSGLALPQATINVLSTANFPSAGTLAVQVAGQAFATVAYTGTTPTSFTGCTGGAGTLSSAPGQNSVGSPVVYMDFNGFYGQGPGANNAGPFQDSTIMPQGLVWAAVRDDPQISGSRRGLLMRIGGLGGSGFLGFQSYGSQYHGQSKLAAYKAPTWTRGQGNIKVVYTAGYQTIPNEITYCATTLVAEMIRSQPKGSLLSSESLGAYSYSVLQGTTPGIIEVRQILGSGYRDVAW